MLYLRGGFFAARVIIADCPNFEAPQRFIDFRRVEKHRAMAKFKKGDQAPSHEGPYRPHA